MSLKSVFGGPVKISDLEGKGTIFEGYTYSWHTTHNMLVLEGEYDKNDTIKLLNQTGCQGFASQKKSVKRQKGKPFEIITTYFLFGVDKKGKIMDDGDHLAVAPCPPLCGTGKTK